MTVLAVLVVEIVQSAWPQSIKSDIISSGFVPKDEKSSWIPVQRLQWLGTVLDSEEFTISISEVRMNSLLCTVQEIEN